MCYLSIVMQCQKRFESFLNFFFNVMQICTFVPSGGRVLLFLMGDSKMYISGTIANSQRTPTERNKTGAIPKVRILVEQIIL